MQRFYALKKHLRKKKLFMSLFAFLFFFMPFMSLLGCIFMPFVFFMRAKCFSKKKKSLKWPDYLIYITTVLTYYINFAASTGCELNHDLHCPSDYLAPKCAKGMLECKKIRKTKEILKEIRNKLLKKKEIKKRTI